MTYGAVLREACLRVVRVGRTVVVLGMASIARCRRTPRISRRMTRRTWDTGVRSGQREPDFAVIERRRAPSIRRVTKRAVHREARSLVIRIRSGVVVLRVARSAICGRAAVLATDVALHALQAGVHARQREASKRCMIELRGCPVRRRMTDGAVSRECSLHVIRVRRSVVVFRVAAKAGYWRALRETVHVTRTAIDCRMHAGQGKAGEFRVIKRGAEP